MFPARGPMLIRPAIGYIMERRLLHMLGLAALILLVISNGIIKQSLSEISLFKWQVSIGEYKVGALDAGESGTRKVAGLTAPAAITAPPARLTFDQPRVSTTSGATGIATPYAGGNPTPITAPSYLSGGAPARFNSPAPAPVYAPPQQQAFAPPAAPAPPPRPQFAPGGRNEFLNMFSPEQQQMTEQQYLGGDSDYTAQIGMYQKALDDFVRRITGRIEGFNTDAQSAIQGNQKNEGMAADQLGQDFGARGLSYSGLFDTSQNKLRDRYSEGRVNIGKNRDTNIQNANEEKANYQAENEISRNNAKRSSLLRMAAQQQLADSQY